MQDITVSSFKMFSMGTIHIGGASVCYLGFYMETAERDLITGFRGRIPGCGKSLGAKPPEDESFWFLHAPSTGNIRLLSQNVRLRVKTKRSRKPLPFLTFLHGLSVYPYKKLSYRRGTARCVMSVEMLPIVTQQSRNYMYDKSWTNRSNEVGGLRWVDV